MKIPTIISLLLLTAICLPSISQERTPAEREHWIKAKSEIVQGRVFIKPGPAQNIPRAVEHFRKAAELGEPEGELMLGRCYIEGAGVKQDLEQGYNWITKSANQGYEDAQLWLANLCTVTGEHRVAVKWLKRAAENGSTAANVQLADHYLEGRGVVQNVTKALELLNKEAIAGDPTAQLTIGNLYANGDLIPMDNAKTLHWYKKLAEQDIGIGLFRLGTLYTRGKGVPKDSAEATRLCRKAAEKGYVHAQYMMSHFCSLGQGTDKDLGEAERWLRKAADAGHSGAEFHLAQLVSDKNGSKAEVFKWFDKAAAQGHPVAQYNLGVMYEHGDGVAKDFAKAKQNYTKASLAGLADAHFNLGVMYAHGKGVPKNYTNAYVYHTLAWEGGVKEAKDDLRSLGKILTEKQKADASIAYRELKKMMLEVKSADLIASSFVASDLMLGVE